MDRRLFLRHAAAGSAFVLLPLGCGSDRGVPSEGTAGGGEPVTTMAPPLGSLELPRARPGDWDATAFNRERGNAGAIPESYRASINADDGATQHLGKHLPYVADGIAAPAGTIAIMWGDQAKGHARHPNAAVSEENPDGHWYDWIRIRKATEQETDEVESRYPAWPGEGFVVQGGGLLIADDGKNTVYLARLPVDVEPGDEIRVIANCLTHGEYVDFLSVPS